MNAWITILLTPWRCGQRSIRILGAAMLILIALGLAALGVFAHAPDAILPFAVLLCLVVFFLWAFFFSGTLLLAIDARRLRLPAIERGVILSLIAHAALILVAAILVLGACGLSVSNTAAALVLSMLSGLGFAILPRYVAVCISVLPGLSIGFKHLIHLPGLDSSAFAGWAWSAALIVLVVDMLRWRQMLRASHHLEQGLSSSMVMQFRRSGAMGEWTALCSPDISGLIRNRPDWMQAVADLRKVGPAHPVNTLRVALGGWYMPRTPLGYLRGLAPFLLPLLAILAVMIPTSIANAKVSMDAWLGFGIGMFAGIGGFGSVLIVLTGVMSLRRRWLRVNSELPLMALLPGLGSVREVKRDLLRASVRLPLTCLTLLWLLVFVLAWGAHVHAAGLLVLSLGLAGCAGVMVALMLNTLGGRPVPAWMLGTALGVAFALFGPSLFMPVLALGQHPWPYAGPVAWILSGVWVVLGLGMIALAHRSWRDLVARAHAFMSNPR